MDRFTKILIITGILSYVAFVFAYETNRHANDVAKLNKFAVSIAPVVKRLDTLEDRNFLKDILRITNHKEIKIYKFVSGKPDEEILNYKAEDSGKNYFDLLATKIIPPKITRIPINFKGKKYGYILVKVASINLLFDFFIGLIIFLSLSIAHFYKKVFDGRTLLEERVLERSAQVIEYENKLATIIQSAENGIIALNENLMVTTINEYAKEFLQITESAIGKPLSTIFNIASIEDKTLIPLDNIFEDEAFVTEKNSRKFLFIFPDDKTIVISLNLAKITQERIEKGWVVSFRDISEEDSLEKKLRQSQKMEAVGQLAGGIAHDFNNLLQVILGYGEFVAETLENKGTEDDIDSWKQVMSAGRKAKDLVSKILIFSRVKREIVMKRTNLNVVIKSILKMIKRLLEENIEVKFSGNSELLKIMCNTGHFEQVLINLCVNARDAMKNGGVIDISLVNAIIDSKSVRGFNVKSGKYVCCIVQDSGEGISNDSLEKIFEPFYTTKGLGKGTGLGLATVYNIVKQHNGFIDVRSELGKGTTFRLYFPALEPGLDEEVDVEEDCKLELGAGEGILIAEDQPEVRSLTVSMLKKAGYKVFQAENGKIAVDQYLRFQDKIQLLLFDVVMPEMSGWDAAKQILEVSPNLPVIFCSGYTNQLVGNDIDCVMVEKPFDKKHLLRIIHNQLKRRDAM